MFTQSEVCQVGMYTSCLCLPNNIANYGETDLAMHIITIDMYRRLLLILSVNCIAKLTSLVVSG